jgi:hypothetical protein
LQCGFPLVFLEHGIAYTSGMTGMTSVPQGRYYRSDVFWEKDSGRL